MVVLVIPGLESYRTLQKPWTGGRETGVEVEGGSGPNIRSPVEDPPIRTRSVDSDLVEVIVEEVEEVKYPVLSESPLTLHGFLLQLVPIPTSIGSLETRNEEWVWT